MALCRFNLIIFWLALPVHNVHLAVNVMGCTLLFFSKLVASILDWPLFLMQALKKIKNNTIMEDSSTGQTTDINL